jgi:hypothetical protein
VPLATPVMRQVARTLTPSTRAATTWERLAVLNLFVPPLCLSGHAVSSVKCALALLMVIRPHYECEGAPKSRGNINRGKYLHYILFSRPVVWQYDRRRNVG